DQLYTGHSRDNYDSIWRQACEAALDVEKLFGAKVSAESCFSQHDIRQRESQLRGGDGVAAVLDIAERPTVHESRPAFERLHQIRIDRVLEQQGHGALRLEIPGAHGALVP